MMMKNKFVIWSVFVILITAYSISAGCTSPQAQTSAPTGSPVVSTPSPTFSPPAVPESLSTTLATTRTTTVPIPTTSNPANDILTVTLNSAEKKTSLQNGVGKAGRVLLILDITIKNNDKRNDFAYTDSSFVLSYKSTNDSFTAITSQYANNRGLINPLISGTVAAGSTDDGKILFGVNSTSNAYTLSVVDSTGTVLTSLNTIYLP
jgi:hypothetical protein